MFTLCRETVTVAMMKGRWLTGNDAPQRCYLIVVAFPFGWR
jgi:hypothetical protein